MHLHEIPFGWGPKGREFKSRRPDYPEARSESGLSASCGHWPPEVAWDEAGTTSPPQRTGSIATFGLLLVTHHDLGRLVRSDIRVERSQYAYRDHASDQLSDNERRKELTEVHGVSQSGRRSNQVIY